MRRQVLLSLFTDFENLTTFVPLPGREDELSGMLDQVVAWARAMKTMRAARAVEATAAAAG